MAAKLGMGAKLNPNATTFSFTPSAAAAAFTPSASSSGSGNRAQSQHSPNGGYGGQQAATGGAAQPTGRAASSKTDVERQIVVKNIPCAAARPRPHPNSMQNSTQHAVAGLLELPPAAVGGQSGRAMFL